MAMLMSAHKLNQAELETRDVARVEQRILMQEMDELLAKALQDEEDQQHMLSEKQEDGREQSDAKLAKALQEDENQRAKASSQQQVCGTRPHSWPSLIARQRMRSDARTVLESTLFGCLGFEEVPPRALWCDAIRAGAF